MNDASNPTREACGDVRQYQQRSRIFRGMSFSVEEIMKATDEIKRGVFALVMAVGEMSDTFDHERQVDCKVACERVAQAAGKIGDRRAQQIATLAQSLAGTFATHLNRRPRP